MRAVVVGGVLVVAAIAAAVALAAIPVTRVSQDPYTNPTSQHKTQVEPDSYSFGSTIVGVFQTGRFVDGGSSDIGWATSTDNGGSWKHGFLPGITKFEKNGPYDRVSDPAVAYDRKHDAWLVSTLPLSEAGGVHGAGVLTSISTDGGLTWGDPVTVSTTGGFDKNWIACDNTPSSRFYGRCYTEWDGNGGVVFMSRSKDGGKTWGAQKTTKDNASGIGGQPVVQPDGVVVVPYNGGAGVRAFRSKNGGDSWTNTVAVASITDHSPVGLRAPSLISAEVDKGGKVYVSWQDCRFRTGCAANDIVYTTSKDGKTWTDVTRIPIDPVDSTVDHFTPGFGVDHTTKGSKAHLGVVYYFYPNRACDFNSCDLHVGFVSSKDGGANWSAATDVAGPMKLAWLPNAGGRFYGDYESTSFGSNGKAYPVFAIAKEPDGSVFKEAMYSPEGGLALGAPATGVTDADRQPVPGAASDHPPYSWSTMTAN